MGEGAGAQVSHKKTQQAKLKDLMDSEVPPELRLDKNLDHVIINHKVPPPAACCPFAPHQTASSSPLALALSPPSRPLLLLFPLSLALSLAPSLAPKFPETQ